MDNTIWEVETPKFDYEIAINYELIRDFAGDAISFLRWQVDHGNEMVSIFIWKVLSLVCLDEAITEYCMDPQSCNNNDSLRAVNNFEARTKILKLILMDSLDKDAVLAMLNILKTGWKKTIPAKMYSAINTVYDAVFHSPSGMSDPQLSIIASALLYTKKYLAFKEYCNLGNSKIARDILIDVYNNSKAAVWNREKIKFAEYWCSL